MRPPKKKKQLPEVFHTKEDYLSRYFPKAKAGHELYASDPRTFGAMVAREWSSRFRELLGRDQ